MPKQPGTLELQYVVLFIVTRGQTCKGLLESYRANPSAESIETWL